MVLGNSLWIVAKVAFPHPHIVICAYIFSFIYIISLAKQKASLIKYVNAKKKIENRKIVIQKDKQTSKFIWPVKGKLISKYGKSKEGFYNDGINIDSKKGTKVMSSQAGKVIYCGNEIPGYGNLILIKHSKNWITAYAHLNEVFTEKGKKVIKGEIIGSVGNTGNVRSPQLHFEIRRGNKAVDPILQISRRFSRRTARRQAPKG